MKNIKPILSAKGITIRVYDRFFFEHTSWQLFQNEQWVILGANGSGKTIFAKALAGLLPLKHGEIISQKKIAYLSFDTQQKILSREERRLDFESAVGKEGKGKTVKHFLGSSFMKSRFTNSFSIKHLLDTSLLSLSTGEMRKVFLLKTLMQQPEILILDEPFDGLDADSKISFRNIIRELMKKVAIILIVHSADEIPQEITHVLVM